MVSQKERDELQRYYDLVHRAMGSNDQEALASLKSQSERFKELQKRVREEHAEQQRLEGLKEDEERQPHHPHQVIWLGPWCSICDRGGYEDERLWSKENNWEGGCTTCGYSPVKYVLAPDQPLPKRKSE